MADAERDPKQMTQSTGDLQMSGRSFDSRPTCVETVKSLTEAIKRLEANARDTAALEDSKSRALHHSASCGTIIVDPRTAANDPAAANGTEAVCRRSSSSSGPGNVVRRAASMLVPVSAMEQVMLLGQCGDPTAGTAAFGHHHGGAPITARPTSILDGMSRSCSALPSYGGGGGTVDLADDDGLILPPSPFRSPDFDDQDDTSCLDGVLATCGYGALAALPPPPPDTDAAATDRDRPNGHHRHLALLGDLQGGPRRQPTGDGVVWATLPSPDDVTPTNENQPVGFGPAGNCSRLLSSVAPPAPPSFSDKCPPVRYSDL